MKYIDAEKLKEKVQFARKNFYKQVDINPKDKASLFCGMYCDALLQQIQSLQRERPEMDLEEFTEKMDAWKARYNHPDNIPIKAAMAFTARMFYQYPNIAREWYDSLPKATQD